MTDQKPPLPPPTFAALLEVFRRSVPISYFRPLAEGGEDGGPTPAFALYRALARLFEQLARQANTTQQARFYLPSALQTAEPASRGIPASGLVTLARVGPSDQALVVEPGRMILIGPGERRFVNVTEIVWNPGDSAPRTVLFVSQILGFAGNLDFLANEDGLLDLDLIQIANQSFDKASVEASILSIDDRTVIQDTGKPDLFTPEDVGLYVKINVAADPFNVGKLRRADSFTWPELEIPVGTGLYPRRLELEDVLRQNPVEVLTEVGGVFTEYYSEAVNELTQFDIPLLPPAATVAVGDATLFGYTSPPSGVSIRFDQPGEGDWEIQWQYWNGVAFVPFNPVADDLTDSFRPPTPGFYTSTWEIPPDWAPLPSPSGSGLNLFFVRANLIVLNAYAVQPLAGRIVLFVPEPLIPEDGTITWELLDFRESNLGLRIAQCDAFGGGRDDDLYLMGDDRGVYQQANETDDEFRDRASRLAEVVSPKAINVLINRALRPFSFTGKAIDVTIDTTEEQNLVGTEFTGLFFDVPADLAPSPPGILSAFDLYAPGDANPQNPYLQNLNFFEAYGFFFVILPYLGEGDFGAFFDEGPLYFDDTAEVYYGPAFTGWFDGFPIDGYATYSAIYSGIEEIKAGGVAFTLIRSENATIPQEC